MKLHSKQPVKHAYIHTCMHACMYVCMYDQSFVLLLLRLQHFGDA